jgi:hypothetical protein
VLFIGDSAAQIVEVDPDRPVTWGSEAEAAAVLVRAGLVVDPVVLDALDEDEEVPWIEVTVSVRWGRAADRVPDAEGVVAVPSGILTLGDTDHEDVVALTPGRWRLQIGLEPLRDAERIDVWLTPADGLPPTDPR